MHDLIKLENLFNNAMLISHLRTFKNQSYLSILSRLAGQNVTAGYGISATG